MKKCRSRRCAGRRPKFFHWPLLVLLVPLLFIVGMSGCHRGGWHSPEKMEKRMTWIEEEVAEDLEIREDQSEAFYALSEKIKTHARERFTSRREAAVNLKVEFDRPVVDIDNAGEILKGHVRSHPPKEELEALIDETAAFYKTLDAEQQATFNEEVSDKLEWFD